MACRFHAQINIYIRSNIKHPIPHASDKKKWVLNYPFT